MVAIESAEEQRALVQYLFGLLGFQKGPLTWIGAKIEPPNNLIMVNKASPKYSNFDINLSEISLTEPKCVKILSLVPKGDGGVHGLWSIDGCHYADSGFVCQRKSGSKLAEMANDDPKTSEEKPGKQIVDITRFDFKHWSDLLIHWSINSDSELSFGAIQRTIAYN